MRVYYDRDADVNLVKGKKIAIVGYGSQGHAHALNLHDSGVKNVIVALRPGSATAAKAEAAGQADIVMVLAPDEHHAALYNNELKANMKRDAALAVAHGFSVHFGL